jgi:hypothetical protein
MEQSFKIFGFITTNDETLGKVVNEVRLMLTVKNGDNSFSGELNVRVPFDNNVVFTNFEDLTEEVVMEWLDINFINSELDRMASIEIVRNVEEAHPAPWLQNDISKLASTLPTDLDIQEPKLPHPAYFDLDAHVANLISKALVEKGLAT